MGVKHIFFPNLGVYGDEGGCTSVGNRKKINLAHL